MALSGTFSGTGQSEAVKGRAIRILMDFAGTASVVIQAKGHDGNWINVETATGDYAKVYEDPLGAEIRLNCTAHTNNVVYSLENREQ